MTDTQGNSSGVQSSGVETPSGKGATDENFPVGSALIRPARAASATATQFARWRARVGTRSSDAASRSCA